MDDPQLDPGLHQQALQGLSRVNWVTQTHRLLWKPIQDYCQKNQLDSLSVLDLACGSGDLLVWLHSHARQQGINLKVTGCDLSPVALEFARRRATQENIDAVFLQRDVLNEQLPSDQDIVVCSLFLHHLESDNIVKLLQRMAESARHLVVAQDLIRSRWGYLMCLVGTQFISRSPIVHVDGPLSVAGALTLSEMTLLAEQAGLAGAQLNHHWPERFVFAWQPSL